METISANIHFHPLASSHVLSNDYLVPTKA